MPILLGNFLDMQKVSQSLGHQYFWISTIRGHRAYCTLISYPEEKDDMCIDMNVPPM